MRQWLCFPASTCCDKSTCISIDCFCIRQQEGYCATHSKKKGTILVPQGSQNKVVPPDKRALFLQNGKIVPFWKVAPKRCPKRYCFTDERSKWLPPQGHRFGAQLYLWVQEIIHLMALSYSFCGAVVLQNIFRFSLCSILLFNIFVLLAPGLSFVCSLVVSRITWLAPLCQIGHVPCSGITPNRGWNVAGVDQLRLWQYLKRCYSQCH